MKYTIVGKGRIGTMLKALSTDAILIGRDEAIPADDPIIVATRCDDLDDVLSRVPQTAREKLIFVQNGMLHSWLLANHLENSTQALLYVAVSARGATPVDGGGSVVHGQLASFFCDVLRQGELQCREVTKPEYSTELIEKYVWNCGFGLLCSFFSCSVGEVVQNHRLAADALLWELAQDTAQLLGVSIDRGICERLCMYSTSIFSYRGAVKEWEWRNGWLWKQHQGALHSQYVEALGCIK